MAMVSKPKCLICGELVEDIGPLDVPFHVECAVKLIHDRNNNGVNGSTRSRRHVRNRKS